MTISYSKSFLRDARKLNVQQRRRLRERLQLFASNPLHPLLRNHALKGKYKSYRSIDIAGDIRALYLQLDDEAIFDTVGTHNQLYG